MAPANRDIFFPLRIGEDGTKRRSSSNHGKKKFFHVQLEEVVGHGGREVAEIPSVLRAAPSPRVENTAPEPVARRSAAGWNAALGCEEGSQSP